jgi:hypothetical protein
VHFWDPETGEQQRSLNIIEMCKGNINVMTVAFSHYFRLYLVVTADFKFHFLNEHLVHVQTIDMSEIRLVHFAEFNDKTKQIVLGGIRGVFIYDFKYEGKYSPLMAASIDPEAKHVKLTIEN